LLLWIDAKFTKRHENYCSKHDQQTTLEEFMRIDAESNIDEGLRRKCDLRIWNDGSIEQLVEKIAGLELANPGHCIPSWDSYFLRLAEFAA
jgi:hypothetical protein